MGSASDGNNNNEYSDDFLLGVTTADGRIKPRDLHERFDIDDYINRHMMSQYDSTSVPTLEEREWNAKHRMMYGNGNKRRGTVVSTSPDNRSPYSRQYLMQMQAYVESKKEYSRLNSKNKRASVPNMPVRDIEVPSADGTRSRTVAAFQLTNPYDPIRQFLFEDCFRSDPVVKRCIISETDVVLGTRAFPVLDIDKEFTTEDIANGLKRQEMERVLSSSEMSMLQTEFNELDKQVKMRSRMTAGLVQSDIGGRAILQKAAYDSDKIPTELKILNWKKIGDVFIDVDTWKIVAIQYADYPEDEPLTPDQIIYHTMHDWHVSPDSLYYGLSRIEPIAATSEINRLLDEVDLKETAKTQWSKTGAVIFPPDTSPETIRNYMQSLVAGTMNGTDIQVKFDLWDLESNLERMFNLRSEDDRRIIRAFGNPMVTIGFEEITNHATVDKVFTFYEQSTIKSLRTWLQDTYEPQWYEPILMQLAPGLLKKIPASTPGIKSLAAENAVKMAAIREGPDSEVGKSVIKKTAGAKFDDSILKRRAAERLARKPQIKVKLEFESVSIESLKDKAPPLIQLHGLRLLTTRGLLKQLNMPQEIEEVEKLEKDFKEEEERKYKDQIDLSKQQIEVGQRRQAFIEQKQKANAVKRASMSDDISMHFRAQSVLTQTQIANAQAEHRQRMENLEIQRKLFGTVDDRIQQAKMRGGI